jgi:hypothetical protein
VAVGAPSECGLNGEQGKEKKCGGEASGVGELAHEESIAIGGDSEVCERRSPKELCEGEGQRRRFWLRQNDGVESGYSDNECIKQNAGILRYAQNDNMDSFIATMKI